MRLRLALGAQAELAGRGAVIEAQAQHGQAVGAAASSAGPS